MAPWPIAVIGGILVSTALSLVVVPSFFLIMDDVSRFLGWAFGRFVGAKEAEPKAPPTAELASAIAVNSFEIEELRRRLAGLEEGEAAGRRRPGPRLQVAE